MAHIYSNRLDFDKKHFQNIAAKIDKSLVIHPKFEKGKPTLLLGEVMPEWMHRLAKDALGNYVWTGFN